MLETYILEVMCSYLGHNTDIPGVSPMVFLSQRNTFQIIVKRFLQNLVSHHLSVILPFAIISTAS
jgi:hypothetical protein